MMVVTRSSAPTRIEQILLTTAQHFEIRALPLYSPLPSSPSLPDVQLALTHGEFTDPRPFRWVDAPTPACCPV